MESWPHLHRSAKSGACAVCVVVCVCVPRFAPNRKLMFDGYMVHRESERWYDYER